MKKRMVLLMLVFKVVVAHGILDLLVSGKEIQKLLFGSKDDIKIVENGTVSKFLQSDVSFPPIRPQYTEFQLRIASEKRLYYSLNLTSSDTTVMPTPTVTIPYVGRLNKQWIVFKIRFPCTRKKSGLVDLVIVFDFFTDSKMKHHYKKVDLSMRRKCVAEPTPSTKKETQGCQKRCDLNNFRKKFCLSSFVARIKVVRAANQNDAEPLYVAHMKRLFKKPQHTSTVKRNQVIKAIGTSLTCDCKPLQADKKYLVFGREDRTNKNLYFDNFSIAYEIKTKEQINLVRRFRKIYRTIWCPHILTVLFGGNYRSGYA